MDLKDHNCRESKSGEENGHFLECAGPLSPLVRELGRRRDPKLTLNPREQLSRQYKAVPDGRLRK